MNRDGRWDTKYLLQVLSRFNESEEGKHAKVQLLLPMGSPPGQREFNIKEIRLVDNILIGPDNAKHKLIIMVE